MGILSRFSDILSANINALLDKAEDPSKMIDQYLRNAMEDLADVKKETASVMAEETKTKRIVDDFSEEIEKYLDLAKKALASGNEEDAKVFLEKKQSLENSKNSALEAYSVAHQNATKMRELHDKLTSDINSLNSRRDTLKAKVSVAKTQEKINKLGASADKLNGTVGAFDRLEDKVNKMLDSANAMAELNEAPVDSAAELEEKYSKNNGDVDVELAELKKSMGL
ncbi:MAG: PspA/IM30 family protein [Oscillospiraceae bacterium]